MWKPPCDDPSLNPVGGRTSLGPPRERARHEPSTPSRPPSSGLLPRRAGEVGGAPAEEQGRDLRRAGFVPRRSALRQPQLDSTNRHPRPANSASAASQSSRSRRPAPRPSPTAGSPALAGTRSPRNAVPRTAHLRRGRRTGLDPAAARLAPFQAPPRLAHEPDALRLPVAG